MATTQQVLTLTVMTCSECALTFAVPAEWIRQRRERHDTFSCPNRHNQWFPTGTSDLEKAEKARAAAEQRATWANSRADRLAMERDAVERSARAYRGHLTRLRNRIADGICPVQSCRRNFANVKAHIATEHPEWAHDHAEALA